VAHDAKSVVSLDPALHLPGSHAERGPPTRPARTGTCTPVGRCDPVDCDWHEVGAKRLSNTPPSSPCLIRTTARRYVYLRLSQSQPDLLWAWIYTDFKDPTRSKLRRVRLVQASRALRTQWRVLALLVGLAGCLRPRAEPAMDSMKSDADHRPGAQQPTKSHEVVPLPEEPETARELPTA